MADIRKCVPINGGAFISDFKTHFSIVRTKAPLAIGFLFVFIAFTIFLAFTPPTSNSSSPIFTQVFTVTNTTAPDVPYPSHISSIFLYFFPNSSSSQSHNANSLNNSSNNFTTSMMNEENTHKDEAALKQQNPQVFKANHTATSSSKEASAAADLKNAGGEKGIVKNLTSSNLMKKQSNVNAAATVKKLNQGGFEIHHLLNCDFFDGNWVRDESYPLYKPNSCSLIDEQFNCFFNGRPDSGYYKLKWKPKGCTLPRLNGSHMLEMLRGKRVVFVGDSLNRNMWESLICILKNSVKDGKKVYEASGKQQFRSEVSYSFVFQDYKFTVEFFVTPFLVQEWEVLEKNGTKKETLRLDLISKFADQYKDADIMVFNTGHWWTHDKTSKGKDYYQEGSHVYDELNVEEAFRKAMTTWGRWIDAKVSPRKSLVFFRGYSASHFSGGQWNSGGQCDNETEPITNDAYLSQYPSKMALLEQVMRGMKTRVTYMNVTKMTDYRKDGHPSMYRKQHSFDLMIQDCSHWCLPGVPDIWNEILYAELLRKLHTIP